MESRTLRKRNNRAALLNAASELFQSVGPDDPTLEQIAARAGVHVQTLYRHFATKNDLAAALDQSYLDRFVKEVEQRGESGILALWRDWIDRSSRELTTTRSRAEGYRKNLRMRYATGSTHQMRLWSQYEDLLTRELARDFDVDPETDSLPRLIACMLWAGNVNAARRWAHAQTSRTLNEECVAVVDDVIALFGDRIQRPADARPTPDAR